MYQNWEPILRNCKSTVPKWMDVSNTATIFSDVHKILRYFGLAYVWGKLLIALLTYFWLFSWIKECAITDNIFVKLCTFTKFSTFPKYYLVCCCLQLRSVLIEERVSLHPTLIVWVVPRPKVRKYFSYIRKNLVAISFPDAILVNDCTYISIVIVSKWLRLLHNSDCFQVIWSE